MLLYVLLVGVHDPEAASQPGWWWRRGVHAAATNRNSRVAHLHNSKANKRTVCWPRVLSLTAQPVVGEQQSRGHVHGRSYIRRP